MFTAQYNLLSSSESHTPRREWWVFAVQNHLHALQRRCTLSLCLKVSSVALVLVIVSVISHLFSPPLLFNSQQMCNYHTWLPEYKALHARVVQKMRTNCTGYWEDLTSQHTQQHHARDAWWIRDSDNTPGFVVVTCDECNGFGDLSNGLVGYLFFAVQTRRALFFDTGQPNVAAYLESTHLEWHYTGEVKKCVLRGPHVTSDKIVQRFNSGESPLGLAFPQKSWFRFFWQAVMFKEDITLSNGKLLPPAMLVTPYDTQTELRFMLSYYGQPRVNMCVAQDDFRYVFTYGCLLRVLFDRPTAKMNVHVASPLRTMRNAPISAAVHIRFGDALMRHGVLDQKKLSFAASDDRRVRLDSSHVAPYCGCAWSFVDWYQGGKKIIAQKNIFAMEPRSEIDTPPVNPTVAAIFALSDSSAGTQLIKEYFITKHAAKEAVFDPIATPNFTEKDFGEVQGKWLVDSEGTASTNHKRGEDVNVFVFSTSGTPQHVMFQSSQEGDIKAMADWLIASAADFLVAARSGFSFSASARSLHPSVTLFQCWLNRLHLH